VEHPAHDLDLLALRVDLHDVGIEPRPCREEVVERRHFDASEAVPRSRVVSRHQSRSRRMSGVQESIATRIRDRLHDDVHVRERVERDIPV
jgi:hypothetical protein